MKKKIIAVLKTKYKNMGFSEKAFDGVATYLETVIKEEADIETACDGVEGLLKVFQGEADALRTAKSAAEKQKQELEDKIKELGGIEVHKKTEEDQKGGEEVPAWAKALIESNKAMAERMNRLDADRLTKSRRQKLNEVIKDLPEALRKPYERMSVDSYKDEEFETVLGEITTEVEGIVSENNAKGAVFGRPGGDKSRKSNAGAEKEATDAEVQAVVDGMSI